MPKLVANTLTNKKTGVLDGVRILFHFDITDYRSLGKQRLCIVTIIQNTWMRCQAKCRVCFKCYSKWAMNGWNNVIWQGRNRQGYRIWPLYHAAANTVAMSFMNYTFLDVERIWHKHTVKYKELFVKQEILIDFFKL